MEQATDLLQIVQQFTEKEDFSIMTDKYDLESQLELLETAFKEIVSWGNAKDFTSQYMGLKKIIKKRLDETTTANKAPISLSVQNDKELPSFSGDFADWQDFVDKFRVAVADKKHLSGAEKFLKLQTCLGINSEAKALIDKFPLHSEDGYEKAWKRLNDHYMNSYEAFRSHVARIFTETAIPLGDGDRVRKLIGKMEASVEKVNVMVKHEDMMSHAAAVHLVSLMDRKTREQWTLNRCESEKVPLLEDVAKFYLTKIKTWDEAKEDRRQDGDRFRPEIKFSQNETMKPFHGKRRWEERVATSTNEGHGQRASKRLQMDCFRCQGRHSLSACKMFASDSPEKRDKLVKDKQLCGICFGRHPEKTCMTRCFKCNGKHIMAFCADK